MERSESDSSLFKYATSTSELAAVMQVVVKTREKHFCRCQKFSVICGKGKGRRARHEVVRGNRVMFPLFLNVTRWGISDRLQAPAASPRKVHQMVIEPVWTL